MNNRFLSQTIVGIKEICNQYPRAREQATLEATISSLCYDVLDELDREFPWEASSMEVLEKAFQQAPDKFRVDVLETITKELLLRRDQFRGFLFEKLFKVRNLSGLDPGHFNDMDSRAENLYRQVLNHCSYRRAVVYADLYKEGMLRELFGEHDVNRIYTELFVLIDDYVKKHYNTKVRPFHPSDTLWIIFDSGRQAVKAMKEIYKRIEQYEEDYLETLQVSNPQMYERVEARKETEPEMKLIEFSTGIDEGNLYIFREEPLRITYTMVRAAKLMQKGKGGHILASDQIYEKIRNEHKGQIICYNGEVNRKPCLIYEIAWKDGYKFKQPKGCINTNEETGDRPINGSA